LSVPLRFARTGSRRRASGSKRRPYLSLPAISASAKQEVQSVMGVGATVRRRNKALLDGRPATDIMTAHDAGWSSPVAREAHNLEVAGSNPVPAISGCC